MAKEKFYVVKVGKQTGIFKTWEECKELTNGYPGAIYKSFDNIKDAEMFLKNNSNTFINKENVNLNEQIKKEINNNITVIFVDGSYDKIIKRYSYGSYIIFKENSEIKTYEFSESYDDKKYLKFRNVSGEIFGIIKSLEWCLQNNKKNVKFYYDYIGIEKWFNNEWKANTEISIFYKKFLNENKNKFDSIQLQKVEAHTGIEYNEKVDKLAKKALIKNSINISSGNNYFCVQNFSNENFNEFLKYFAQYEDLKIKKIENQPEGITQYSISKDKNKIILNYYNNSTLLVQGKISSIYTLAITKICDFS